MFLWMQVRTATMKGYDIEMMAYDAFGAPCRRRDCSKRTCALHHSHPRDIRRCPAHRSVVARLAVPPTRLCAVPLIAVSTAFAGDTALVDKMTLTIATPWGRSSPAFSSTQLGATFRRPTGSALCCTRRGNFPKGPSSICW